MIHQVHGDRERLPNNWSVFDSLGATIKQCMDGEGKEREETTRDDSCP